MGVFVLHVFLNGSVCFLCSLHPPTPLRKRSLECLAVGCVFLFFLVGGGLVFESSVLLGKVVSLVSGRLSQGKGI